MSTSNMPPAATRRSVRTLAPAVLAGAVLVAAPARADVPVGWTEPAEVSGLDMLLVLVVAPVAAVLLVGLLAMLPGFVRGEGFTGRSADADDQWFGGPKDGAAGLPPGEEGDEERRAITGGSGATW